MYETFYIKTYDRGVYQRLSEKRCQDGLHLRLINDTNEFRCVAYYLGCLVSNTGYYEHRVDGPAIINCFHSGDGRVDFIVRDWYHYYTREFCEAAGMSDEETFMWVLRFGDMLPTTCKEYYGDGWRSMSLEEF